MAVKAENVNNFKNSLDKYWYDQEAKFNWKTDTEGSISTSNAV